jgi:hypothetical protein
MAMQSYFHRERTCRICMAARGSCCSASGSFWLQAQDNKGSCNQFNVVSPGSVGCGGGYCQVGVTNNENNWSVVPNDGECHAKEIYGPGGRYGMVCCKANNRGNTAIPCAKEFKGGWKARTTANEVGADFCYSPNNVPPAGYKPLQCAAGQTGPTCVPDCSAGETLSCVPAITAVTLAQPTISAVCTVDADRTCSISV